MLLAVVALEMPAPAPAQPAYVARGDDVDARYHHYRRQLERFFDALAARLEAEAPDLRSDLDAPAPLPHGYQILPKIVHDAPRPRTWTGVKTSSYSWAATEAMIDRERARLVELERRLDAIRDEAAAEHRAEYRQLVDQYKRLAAGQKLIASHVDYNRLWQREIARDPLGYARLTALHDAVLERHALFDAIAIGDPDVVAGLRDRAEQLSDQIEKATPKFPAPDFARVDRPSPQHWTVTVPLYTDIADASFVDRFRAFVERVWQIRDGDDLWSVVVDIRPISTRQLYHEAAIPMPGAHIDLAEHIGRFPRDGAVLTTGATTTHVLGRSINLGPHDISPNTLAHEFGHVLGFVDRYVRGYRDRGPEGYEVLEVILDLGDIMGSPGFGRVERSHFEQLLLGRDLGPGGLR